MELIAPSRVLRDGSKIASITLGMNPHHISYSIKRDQSPCYLQIGHTDIYIDES
jgi:hypothetical protein